MLPAHTTSTRRVSTVMSVAIRRRRILCAPTRTTTLLCSSNLRVKKRRRYVKKRCYVVRWKRSETMASRRTDILACLCRSHSTPKEQSRFSISHFPFLIFHWETAVRLSLTTGSHRTRILACPSAEHQCFALKERRCKNKVS